MHVIYSIYCSGNNREYIGSSINSNKRKRQHFNDLNKNKHSNKKLQSAYNKYGKSAFEFIIIEEVENPENLISREQYYIDIDNPWFNISKTAGSSLGLKRTNKTKEKIRLANLGLKHPDWRKNIKSKAQGGDNHWTKNKKFSEKSKHKMSESQKKLYENGYISPRKGVKLSNDFKKFIGKVNSKPVNQYTLDLKLIKTWPSAAEASRYGYRASSIGSCCRNKTKTYKNFIWKFVNE